MRRHRHHPLGDLGQQQVGQREVAEVVGADLALEAVDGLRVRHRHDACVVDQHVDAVDAVGEGAHRRQVLQVELADLDVAGHGGGGFVALGGVAHGQDRLGPDTGELACGDQSQAAVGAGDDHGASGERRQIRGGPISHDAHPKAETVGTPLASSGYPHACGRGSTGLSGWPFAVIGAYFGTLTSKPAMTASMSGASSTAFSA